MGRARRLAYRSTTRRSRPFAPASAAATRTRRSWASSAHRPTALGRSPTMREFAADEGTTVHPQTVIERFGSWNAASGRAGLVAAARPRAADLVALLGELGAELGRPPTARDLDEHRERMPSKSLYWHTFGSLTQAPARGRVRRPGGGRSGSSGRWSRGPPWRARLAACRSSPTGPRRGRPIRRSSRSGRSTGCSSRAAARGRRSSISSGEALRGGRRRVRPDGSVA